MKPSGNNRKTKKCVLLAFAAGDNCGQASDHEEVPQDFVTAFESAGSSK